MTPRIPTLRDVKETALYVSDLGRAKSFYCGMMGLPVLLEDARFCALNVAGRHVLLLFLRGSSAVETRLQGGIIPPHDGQGKLHVGLSVDHSELAEWEEHLTRHKIEILSYFDWPRGGRSIYFRDPDGHLLELLTPGVWATY